MTEMQWKSTRSKRPILFLCASVPKNGWQVYFILLWIIIEFPFQWYASSLCIIFMPNNLNLLTKNKCWMNQKAQIPQCPGPISHNALFCKKKMHIAVAIWCIVGYLSDALWQMWDGSINSWIYFLASFRDKTPPMIHGHIGFKKWFRLI